MEIYKQGKPGVPTMANTIKFLSYLLMIVLLNSLIILNPVYIPQLSIKWNLYILAFWMPILAVLNALIIFIMHRLTRNSVLKLSSGSWVLIYIIMLCSFFVIQRFN